MKKRDLWICVVLFFACAVGFAALYKVEEGKSRESVEQMRRCKVYYDVLEACRLQEDRGGYKVEDCLAAIAGLNKECRCQDQECR